MGNIILDFDGTLTDTDKEAVPFLRMYTGRFADRIGMPVERLNTWAGLVQAEVLADPTTGWLVDGKIMAPACADPYVLNQTVYDEIIERLRDNRLPNEGYEIPEPGDQTQEFMTELFRECYGHTDIAFRPQAKEFLDDLVSKHRVAIVTNSGTDKVIKKLTHLGNYNGKVKVIGNAKKYVPTDFPPSIPEEVEINGFPRPVVMRRGHYFMVLEGLDVNDGFTPENTTVVGDIYELDLALPEHLGYRGVLLETDGTRACEFPYFASQPNLHLAKDFQEIKEVLSV